MLTNQWRSMPSLSLRGATRRGNFNAFTHEIASLAFVMTAFASLFFMANSAAANASDVSHPELSQAELMEMSQRVSTPAVLRGQFTQVKTINGMLRPLTSTGQFVYSKDAGLLWQVQQPFASTLIMSPQKIVEIDDLGNRKTLTAGDNPGMALFMKIFLAIAGGDLTTLQDYFAVHGEVHTTPWLLELAPTDPELKKLLRKAEINGAELLQGVRVDEANGDSSVITYQNVTVEPATLTPAERALFTQ